MLLVGGGVLRCVAYVFDKALFVRFPGDQVDAELKPVRFCCIVCAVIFVVVVRFVVVVVVVAVTQVRVYIVVPSRSWSCLRSFRAAWMGDFRIPLDYKSRPSV